MRRHGIIVTMPDEHSEASFDRLACHTVYSNRSPAAAAKKPDDRAAKSTCHLQRAALVVLVGIKDVQPVAAIGGGVLIRRVGVIGVTALVFLDVAHLV